MIVHYVLISYKWNFLAEGTMRSLPHYVQPFLIHNGKSESFARLFSKDRPLMGEFNLSNLYHGHIIDALFERSEFKHVIECDALIMIDHDCWFATGAFQNMERKFLHKLANGLVIVGTGKLPRIPDRSFFMTIPLFAIKPSSHWPASWFNKHYRKKHYDTGQWLSHFIPQLVGNIDLDDACRFYHWGSHWQFLNDHKDPKRMNFVHIRKHYKYLLGLGIWHPCKNELMEMRQYRLLKNAVDAYIEYMQTPSDEMESCLP